MINIDLRKSIFTYEGQIQLKVKTKITDEKIIGVFGNSGSGKTTLLRMIAGLVKPDYGSLNIDDEIWYCSDRGINLKTHKRDIGFVFQNYTIFPNMTVYENILYGNPSKKKADDLLELMQLEKFKNHNSNKLSGGQKQRVAIARALSRNPKILLMDEPFSSLDKENKIRMFNQLNLIKERTNSKMFFVSHDIVELKKFSDIIWEIKTNGETHISKHFDIGLKVLSFPSVQSNSY